MSTSASETRGLRGHESTRMTFLQVRNLIEHLRKQHRRLREAYRSREERPNASGEPVERTDLVFGYLARREDDLEGFLERLSSDERDEIVATWLQYADLSAYDRKVEAMIESPPEKATEAVAEIVSLDRELIRLYERFEHSVRTPTVRNFFADLREIIEQRVREHAEQLQQVDDL